MTFPQSCLAGLLALATGGAGAACYTVYDRANRVVYQSAQPPVDMSRPLHQTLPQAFPGGHLVFDGNGDCPVLNTRPAASPLAQAARQGRAPLLTDRRTAEALGLPYAALTPNVVMVPDAPATLRPGLSVVPAGLAPGPAAAGERPATQTMGAAPAGRTVVITEMHDPPLVGVQRGAELTIQGR